MNKLMFWRIILVSVSLVFLCLIGHAFWFRNFGLYFWAAIIFGTLVLPCIFAELGWMKKYLKGSLPPNEMTDLNKQRFNDWLENIEAK